MNGIKILLDSNIILYLLDGDETLANFLEQKELYISIITEMELLSYKGFTNEEEIHVRNFLSECRSIGIDNDIKTEVIYLRRKFGNKLPDSIIAATSICMDIPLITADHDFKKIEKLQLIFYEKIK